MRVCYIATTVFAVLAISHITAQQTATFPQRVTAADLHDGKVRVVGMLGAELGQPFDVVGRWTAPESLAKPTGLTLMITHVDGRKLDNPVAFAQEHVYLNDPDKKPKSGDVLAGRCFESGQFKGTPVAVLREMRPVQVPYGFGFKNVLVFYQPIKP